MARLPRVRLPPVWGVDPVPPDARTLRGFDFFVLWFSLGIGLLVLAAGALLTRADFGFGMSLSEAVLVIVVGSVVGSVMLAAAGGLGARHGVPTMVSLRAVLGRRGSYAPTALNVLQLLGWASFEVMVMAEAAASLLGHAQGSVLNYLLVGAFAGFCALLAIGGPIVVVRQWLEKFAVWFVIGSTAWLTFILFTSPSAIPWGGFRSDATTLLLGIDLVIALPISWWPLVSDYNRFARGGRGAFAGTAAGYAVANAWFFLLGAALIVIVGEGNVISSILALTLGTLALLLILVDETDNGFADVYSAAVSLQNLFPRVRQRAFVAVITVLSIVVGSWLTAVGGLEGAAALAYEGFLLLIGGVFVPLLGVLVSDFLLVRRRGYDRDEFYDRAPSFLPPAIGSWLAGAFVYAYLLFAPGLGWPSVPLGSSLPAFGTAVLVHYIVARRAVRARATARH